MEAVVCGRGREYFKLTSNCHCPKCTEGKAICCSFLCPSVGQPTDRPHHVPFHRLIKCYMQRWSTFYCTLPPGSYSNGGSLQ